MKNNYEKGKRGEALAEQFLIKKQHKIIEKNYYCRHGEIDIISEKDSILYFTEVKYLTGQCLLNPVEQMTDEKIGHLMHSIAYYLKQKGLFGKNYRLSFIGIVEKKNKKLKLTYIKDILN